MAASSERSPPPFPESEDQEPDPETGDGDSDEGEDIFTGKSIPVEAKIEPLLQESGVISEAPSDIFSEPLADVLSEPSTDIFGDSPVDFLSDPPVHIRSDSPVDLLRDPPIDIVSDPPVDILSDPPVDTLSDPPVDIFSDPPVDILRGPPVDLLRDSPVDLLRDSPVDLLRDSPVDLLRDSPVDLLRDSPADIFNEPPADLFSEESVPTTTTAVTTSNTVTNTQTNSKTNGIHSDDEEQDIFAEATVELSLDSPANDRKKREPAKTSTAVPSISVAPSTSKMQAKSLEELEEEESEDKFELNIAVTNPEKVGDGMNAYMAYKVSTQTTLPMFRNKTFTVRRRFSDFLGLFEKLSEKHSQNGYIVPPPPEKSLVGMTKVKVGKEDPSSAEFVERRRAALERYLQRVVLHPSLLQDPDVREFLEKEELPRAVSTQTLSGAGFLKMINKATEAVSKMTIKMNESDIWFEEKLQEVEVEDQQLRKLHAMVDSLVSHRKELSGNTAVFAKSVAMLGSSEDNTALSRALSQLAEVEDKIEQLHQEQASSDFFIFAELLADYIRLLGAVRSCFDQRMKTWQRWQDSQNMLQKKRENEAKLLWANKPEKLQQAKDEITEWEAKVTQFERDFERISATVRKEVLRFEKEKARDFKNQIVKYLESLLRSQQQLIKYWEAFLPEAKAIA
ncbi:sorting nexin-1a [Conger conger]|uniref:sorting nexin-1a n=1 Tax=Conger conger TaxID=82655 RepID=UPI002A59C826|nr:sorting nexin-1a [Conger conger]XP_061077203.1 sorting nexin-1a [Conger conger]XP_061077204.1 sorting nexin-1a [Conger conger]